MYDLFMANKPLTRELICQQIVPTLISGIDLLPATMTLATRDRAFGHQEGMGLVLRDLCRLCQHDYDYVLIDCSPVLGVLMVNALAASDHIIIPVQTEFLAIKGLERMIKTMKIMGRSKSIDYSFSIVATMYDRRTKAAPLALETLSQHYHQHLWSEDRKSVV